MRGKQGHVLYKTGASACFSSNKSLALDAANEIRDNDLVLVVVGDTGDKDPACETCGEGKDRTSLSLSGTQLDLTSDVGRSHKTKQRFRSISLNSRQADFVS